MVEPDGGDLLRAAEEMVKEVAKSQKGTVRYRLAPYRDQLRELLISSPLSIRAMSRLLESLGVHVSGKSLGAYLKREWPDEFQKHASRLRGGAVTKVSSELKPKEKPVEKKTAQTLEKGLSQSVLSAALDVADKIR